MGSSSGALCWDLRAEILGGILRGGGVLRIIGEWSAARVSGAMADLARDSGCSARSCCWHRLGLGTRPRSEMPLFRRPHGHVLKMGVFFSADLREMPMC